MKYVMDILLDYGVILDRQWNEMKETKWINDEWNLIHVDSRYTLICCECIRSTNSTDMACWLWFGYDHIKLGKKKKKKIEMCFESQWTVSSWIFMDM